eukprot:482202-Rhodomonas_salina.2
MYAGCTAAAAVQSTPTHPTSSGPRARRQMLDTTRQTVSKHAEECKNKHAAESKQEPCRILWRS